MEFANENIQSENPFVDILMKNLKILIYNTIIKDEYAADRAETEESIDNAETYMACMENRVSLNMFKDIPEQFLREVGLPEHTIREYVNFQHETDVIPKDTGGLDANGRLIRAGDTVIKVNDKWIVPTITKTIEDFLDLPLYATTGDIYRVEKAGGTDSYNNDIKAGDLLLREDDKWSILSLKLVDTYENLPEDAKVGDQYIVLGYLYGMIHSDVNNIPIQEGNTVIKLEDGWHVLNPHMINSFIDLPIRAQSGDIYKVDISGGLDANKRLIPGGGHVVRINNKWYVLNTHRELDKFDTLSSTLIASSNGIYFEAVDNQDRLNREIHSGDLVAKVSDKGYSVTLNDSIIIEDFDNFTVLMNADPLYQVLYTGSEDSSGREIQAEDLLIRINSSYYVATVYGVSTYESLPDLQYVKNGDVFHISDLNIKVGKVGNSWYLFNNLVITIDTITESFATEESKNVKIEFNNKKWYIVDPANKRSINSYYDLPELSTGDLCRVSSGGIDSNGITVEPEGLVVRYNNDWYKVSLYKTDTYESLKDIQANDGDLYQITEVGTNVVKLHNKWYICKPAFKNIESLDVMDLHEGDMFTVRSDGGIDATGTIIRSGDTLLRMKHRWYICNDYLTVYNREDVFQLYDGDTFKVLTAGGYDINNKKIEENDTVVCIDKKFYLCSKSVKTSVENFLYLPSPGLMYTIKESGGITRNYQTVKAGDTIVLTEDDWILIDTKVIESYIYLPYTANSGSIFLIKESGTTFRAQLVKKLRPWFLLNFNELNEYYRKITGKPPLNDWGIPVRDYESIIYERLPGFIYYGDFLHEIGPEACQDLEDAGILDIVRQDYPKAEYLNYLTAGLSSYDCRKCSDFMILWIPDNCDELLTREFNKIYNERRDFVLRMVYNTAMELESEHYHSTMQIYLLVMTMVDMIADVQSHIVKKDLLDRRCIEFIFSMYGVPYYREIPLKYQKRICYNLHRLIKYKACTENFDVIKEVFDMKDLEFFKYYLLKVNQKDLANNLIWQGSKVPRCIYNEDFVKTEIKTIEIPQEKDVVVDCPLPNYIDNGNKVVLLSDNSPFTNYSIDSNKIKILYNDINSYSKLIVIFIYSDIGTVDETRNILPSHVPTSDAENIINVNFPISKYIEKGNYFHVVADGKTFTKYYRDEEKISILYRDIASYSSLEVKFVYSTSNIIETTQKEVSIDIEQDYAVPTSIIQTFPIDDFNTKGNHVIVTVDNTILPTNKYTINNSNNTISIPYNNIKTYSTLELTYIYSTTSDKLTKLEIPITVSKNYIDIPEPCENYTTNNWPVFVIADNKLLGPENYDIIDTEFETYPITTINTISQLKFVFFYLNKEPYIYDIYEENYDQTKSLRFSKIQMNYINSVQHLLDQMNWKKYDRIVKKDPWWVGKEYKDGEHEIVKQAILNAEYNYMRTKYFSLHKMVDLSTSSIKISLFFSALYDDIFNETFLTLRIPSLSNTHQFNLAHLFLFMTALTRLSSNLDDNIEQVTETYLATGFNYKANLRRLRNWIISKHYDPEYFQIWNMIIPDSDITDIDEFMKIQDSNEKIYFYIQYKMLDSHDYREYKMWRAIMDYLMTWKYNLNYFKLNDGSIAKTYTDFLQEKDIVLYTLLIKLINIKDDEERIDMISNTIDDICLVIEQHIDKKLARYVFSDILGKNSSTLLKYVIKIVEFFKSFKIMLRAYGEVNSIGDGGFDTLSEDNVLHFYDYFDSKCIMRKNEYINIEEELHSLNTINSSDTYRIKEDCVIIHKHNKQEEDVTNVD